MGHIDVILRDFKSHRELKFGFGRDVPLRNLKDDSCKYQFFKKKVTNSYANPTNFAPNFEQNHLIFPKIFLNLSQFWLKFGKIVKNQPIHIPNFAFYKGSFIYQEADFATHVGGMSPYGLLY